MFGNVLQRVSAALSQLIQPIASSSGNAVQQSFQRYTPQERLEPQQDQKKQEDNQSRDSPAASLNPNGELSDNVVPLFPPPEKQATQPQGSGAPILDVLTQLAGKRIFLLGWGRKVYDRVRRDQSKGRMRKGVILDQHA